MQYNKELIEKYVRGRLSKQEKKHLKKWVQESEINLNYFKENLLTIDSQEHEMFNYKSAFHKFLEKTQKETPLNSKWNIYKYAAIFIGILVLGLYFANNTPQFEQNKIISITESSNQDSNIKVNLGNKVHHIKALAYSSLKDIQGNIVAEKEVDYLSFKPINTDNTPSEVFVPYGQKFKIELMDGTLVWLNAGTKISFPKQFASDKRLVQLSGEAYFEVAKNKEKPFIVATENINVEVVGTHFNISAYEEDQHILTTLLEGAVNVYNNMGEEKIALTPNLQADFSKETDSFKVKKVNTNSFTAWKDNTMIFDGVPFSEIMKKIKRNFNVEIQNNNQKLNNAIYKGEFTNESVETILSTIALSTPFEYSYIENKIVID